MFACTKRDHHHVEPVVQGVGDIVTPTFGIYHLKVTIKDRYNTPLIFTRPFLAVEHTPTDSQILLGRPSLKEFRINLLNGVDEWEFAKHVSVEGVSPSRFTKELTPSSQVMAIHCVFRPDAIKIDQACELRNDSQTIPPFLEKDFADCFDLDKATALPRHRGADHDIQLQPGKEPPYLKTYSMSPGELRALEAYLNEALEKGWIRPSKSSAGAPVLFVPQKDGSMRVCIDYRGLNSITLKNRYPLPLISELLDRLSGSLIFSKIDLKNAYYRIRIKEGDEWKTAFRTKFGHFEYLVMPFGLTNAPATFQTYINQALRGLIDNFCIVYLDDILVFSKNAVEHENHLRLVMERLRDHDLYANPAKCSFFQTEVEFLGFIVDQQGLRMDPSRISAIAEWRSHPPVTYRDVQVFLGFCNFYRRFIFGFSRIARPLHILLKGMRKGRKPGKIGAEWGSSQNQAFNQLIDAFITTPVLRHYDPFRPCRVETDASDAAAAGILSQKFEDNCWHPIAYYSRKFTGAELNYPIYDKEMMAIVLSFQHWRHYLQGAPDIIEVWSDHENLSRFMKQTALNGRQSRWLTFLIPYDFTIYYRKGALNPADGLSRRPDHKVSRAESGVSKLMPSIANRLATAQVMSAVTAHSRGLSASSDELLSSGPNLVLATQVVTRGQSRKALSTGDVDVLDGLAESGSEIRQLSVTPSQSAVDRASRDVSSEFDRRRQTPGALSL